MHTLFKMRVPNFTCPCPGLVPYLTLTKGEVEGHTITCVGRGSFNHHSEASGNPSSISVGRERVWRRQRNKTKRTQIRRLRIVCTGRSNKKEIWQKIWKKEEGEDHWRDRRWAGNRLKAEHIIKKDPNEFEKWLRPNRFGSFFFKWKRIVKRWERSIQTHFSSAPQQRSNFCAL